MLGGLSAHVVPLWETKSPGRYQHELDALRTAQAVLGVRFDVDEAELSQGRLCIHLQWPLNGQVLPLEARYPDGFPRFRPIVRLLLPPEQLPPRHCSPIDGILCLLGRDTAQWDHTWSLVQLLSRQLKDAIQGTGEEDPQGEPVEFWWNTIVEQIPPEPLSRESYCLVDSAWHIAGTKGGKLKLRYETIHNGGLNFHGAVAEVRDSSGHVLASFPYALVDLTRTIDIPWVHLRETFVPNPDLGSLLQKLYRDHPELANAQPFLLGKASNKASMVAVSYPMETGWQTQGTGWLFLLVPGKESVARRNGRAVTWQIIRTLRAGVEDLGLRSPAVSKLTGKRGVIFGAGAIGAPIAIELARNGCSILDIVEYDIIEPGNSVRWPLGVPVWGQRKADALKKFISQNYPNTVVNAHHQFVGNAPDDDALAKQLLAGADFVVDACASNGVTMWLGDCCRASNVPVISAFASHTLSGGVVAVHAPTGGCPQCLAWAWETGKIKPVLEENGGATTQPPGCSERTFTGSSFDLAEISMHAVRVIAERNLARSDSVAFTLRFESDISGMRMPVWRCDEIPVEPKCGCRPSQ